MSVHKMREKVSARAALADARASGACRRKNVVVIRFLLSRAGPTILDMDMDISKKFAFGKFNYSLIFGYLRGLPI